jgi:hypothetical protein
MTIAEKILFLTFEPGMEKNQQSICGSQKSNLSASIVDATVTTTNFGSHAC